jgi:hypothetical protein
MASLDRLKRIEQRVKGTENPSDTSTFLPLHKTLSVYDELAERMRAGILESLRPFFVEGDSFSGVLMHTIKRMLQKADVVDLTNVLISADGFITEMRPFLDEYEQQRDNLLANNQAENSEDTTTQAPVSDDSTTFDKGHDTNSGRSTDGQGNPDWEDEIREIHALAVHHQNIHEAIPTAGESVNDRHEATVEGYNSSNGSTPGAALS